MENRSSVLDGVDSSSGNPLEAPAPALPVPVAPAPALPTPE
jgi:hypothetical protein